MIKALLYKGLQKHTGLLCEQTFHNKVEKDRTQITAQDPQLRSLMLHKTDVDETQA